MEVAGESGRSLQATQSCRSAGTCKGRDFRKFRSRLSSPPSLGPSRSPDGNNRSWSRSESDDVSHGPILTWDAPPRNPLSPTFRRVCKDSAPHESSNRSMVAPNKPSLPRLPGFHCLHGLPGRQAVRSMLLLSRNLRRRLRPWRRHTHYGGDSGPSQAFADRLSRLARVD